MTDDLELLALQQARASELGALCARIIRLIASHPIVDELNHLDFVVLLWDPEAHVSGVGAVRAGAREDSEAEGHERLANAMLLGVETLLTEFPHLLTTEVLQRLQALVRSVH